MLSSISFLRTAATAALLSATAFAGNSSLRVVPSNLDLGQHELGGVAQERFFVVNDSDAPLEISKIKGRCGCLEVQGFQPRTLAPHTAMAVPFEVRIPDEAREKDVRVDVFAGDVLSTVTVKLAAVAAVPAAATAEAAVNTSPIAVLSSQTHYSLPVGESANGSAWIINQGTETLRVRDVKGSCGCTKIEGAKNFELAPGEAREVAFQVSAGKAPSPAKAKLVRFVTESGVHTARFQLTTEAADGAALQAGL